MLNVSKAVSSISGAKNKSYGYLLVMALRARQANTKRFFCAKSSSMVKGGCGWSESIVAVLAQTLSMAETNCARRRGKSVPVWLIKKGGEALGSVLLV